jgi:tetratricopeptide (TPR) repeat protein
MSRQASELTPNQYLEQIQSDLKTETDVQHEFIQNLENETKTYDRTNIPRKAVLYWKGNRGCNFTIAKRANPVKILIQDCHDCIFTIQGPILTSFAEVWRCSNIVFHVNSEIGTLQLDLSQDVRVSYTHKKYLGSIVQAGVTNLSIEFKDSEEENIVSGLQVLKPLYADIDDNIDQFITRWINKELKTEILIRTQGGYPTTERELVEMEENAEERNRQNAEKLLHMTGNSFGLDENNLIAKSVEGKAETKARQEKESASNLKKNAGNKAFIKKNYEQAIQRYSEGIEINPDHTLYSNRAACFVQLGQWENALEDAHKCLELKEDFAKGYFRKGVALFELGRYEEAVEALKEAYDLEPEDAEINSKLNEARQRSSSI